MVRALVIRAAGTNCDAEMVRAFEMAGAVPTLEHVDRLIAEPRRIQEVDLIGFPGGFSYGDDIASGRIFAMKLRERLYPALRDAAAQGVPMIGACNGFQVMVQVGLLPGPDAGRDWPKDQPPGQSTALSYNVDGRFIDRWVRFAVNDRSACIWTKGLTEAFGGPRSDAAMMLPIAHGEGRFVASGPDELSRLERNGQVAIRYLENPNGSEADIAGICDPTGRIFGLMPHPERYLDWTLHPFWTRLNADERRGPTPGLMMFQNAVGAARGVGGARGARGAGVRGVSGVEDVSVV